MAVFFLGGQNLGHLPCVGSVCFCFFRRRASWRCDRISAQGAAWWHPLRSRFLENYGLYKGNLEQCAIWKDIEPGSLGFHFLSPRCFESLLMPFVAPEDGIRLRWVWNGIDIILYIKFAFFQGVVLTVQSSVKAVVAWSLPPG